MTYVLLFWEFLKVGMFAVGGGLATIPFLQEMTTRYDWFDTAMLANMIAVGESTPGPIGVNVATYAGITAGGIPGGFVATFALTLPSYLIILVVARILQKFRSNFYVNAAFSGIRPVVTALIAYAGWGMVELSLVDLGAFETGGLLSVFLWPQLVLFGMLFFVSRKWKKLHPIALIAIAAVVGIVLKL